MSEIIRLLTQVTAGIETALKEEALINVMKNYKPRRLKMDYKHLVARRLYKIKSRNPAFKRKQKLTRTKWLKKNGNAQRLEKRADRVHKIREQRGLD